MKTRRTNLFALFAALACFVGTVGCGNCRLYATRYEVPIAPPYMPPGAAPVSVTCRFDGQTLTASCSASFLDTTDGKTQRQIRDKVTYRSRANFVDEAKLPGRVLATGYALDAPLAADTPLVLPNINHPQIVPAAPNIPFGSTTVTNTFNGRHQLLEQQVGVALPSGSLGPFDTVYTSWDDHDRPLANDYVDCSGSIGAPERRPPWHFSYDDKNRILHYETARYDIVFEGTFCTPIVADVHFDANGNLTGVTSPTGAVLAQFVVKETEWVCK